MTDLTIDPAEFRYDGTGARLVLEQAPTIRDPLYKSKKSYRKRLEDYRDDIDDLQRMMYAHDRYAMLAVFQAMDAAGKDSTIRNVFRGVNPHGLQLFAFKQPNDTELDHGFLWRSNLRMPERGRIGVFNRSYYEEVLVVRVHPEILRDGQRLPAGFIRDREAVWRQRFEDIRNMELYAHRNGTCVVKFFLNVSREEQTRRFLSRIDEAEKNWKFSIRDVEEQRHWDDYMGAYEECINATAASHAPWYVVPADDKWNMRLIVAQIVLHHLRALDIEYPKVSAGRRRELQKMRSALAGSPGRDSPTSG